MPTSLASALKHFAVDELGFDLVGITTADAVDGASALREWVAAGRHGEMSYMAATLEIRTDPRRLLAGTRSVICVAMSYHDDPEPPETAAGGKRVVVARYARRKDYHGVLRRRLVRLGRFLAERRPGADWRPAVDTAPLLEKELAQRAGLGWIGKNTCLINRRLGSELLLGELLTTVELPPDQPAPDHCGRCTACLDACPTAALPQPRRLDARRCISYLTIEHRSQLSDPQARAIGHHLAGCDICQAVCPWNRKAPTPASRQLAVRPRLQHLDLRELERLDADGWLELSRGTPLRRLDFSRFRRNLAAVSANLAPPRTGGAVS